MENRLPIGYDTELFNQLQSKFDEEFTNIVHSLPKEILSYVKGKILEAKTFFKQSNFQLEVIVDTNILYSEVRSLMLYDSSFFLKIADNPFIKIYAPSQLKEELYSKIKIKIPKDAKTKGLDINQCLGKADLLLSKVIINDSITSASFEKAKSYLSDRDADDISFVALNFTLNTHGVLTRDKDIIDQKEIKTWKLSEAGQVITEMNKASFSFLILNVSLSILWEMIYALVITIWNAFIEMVQGFILFFASVLSGSVSAIANMPPALAVIAGIATIIILLVDDLRNGLGELLKLLWEEIRKMIVIILDLFKAIWGTLKEIFEALKPFLKVSIELLGYMALQSIHIVNRLEELETSRPEYSNQC